MQLEVLNIKGKKTGRSVQLSDEIFAIEPNDHLIYLAVKNYLASKHRGTHKTKGRSEIAGSTRKLHRQKGTGGSRKGDIKNPLYHGGGTIFGPKPHSYGFKMNRKEKDLAKISALSYKATAEAIRVVENFKLDAPKTKDMFGALQNLEISNKKVLYVTADHEENLFLSLRNIPRVKSITLSNINTYDIVNSNYLVFTEDAAQILADEEGIEAAAPAVKEEKPKAAPKKAAAKKKEAEPKAESKKAAPKRAAAKKKTDSKAEESKEEVAPKKTVAKKKEDKADDKEEK